MSELEPRIAAYLAHRMPDATNIAVDDLARIHGGSSQETFRLNASWQQAGEAVERRLILRREPPSGLVIAERDLEYNVYCALAGTGVPVPRAYFLELDASWLDRPFFIMDMMPGKPGHFYAGGDPFEGMGPEITRRFWHHLGTLARLDHRALGLQSLRNGQQDGAFWLHELDHWQKIIQAGETIVEPIVHGALRWLRRHPPAAAQKPAIVHGDYRAGNFLFTPDAQISAVLDWEMAHVGDPLEDIAWALDPFWSIARHLPEAEGLAIWQAASGLVVDPAALDWWRLFAAVKGCGIWTTAEASFAEGKSGEMVVALSGIRGNALHRRVILDRMAERGAMG